MLKARSQNAVSLGLLAVCLAALTGCGGGSPAAPKVAPPPVASAPAPPPVAGPGQPPPVATAPLPPTVIEKADVGMTKKGDYGGDPISTPISAMWKTKERLVLIQIQQAMQLFEGTEGRKPKSHAEFMDKIIAANAIRLPELPPGHLYLYDPKTNELMVERPR